MHRLLQCDKLYNESCLQTEYLWKATSNAFWDCGVNMRVVKKSTPEDSFSNRIEGKNYLGWILALIHTEICITRCGCGELYSAETDEVCAVLYLMELMFILDENK